MSLSFLIHADEKTLLSVHFDSKTWIKCDSQNRAIGTMNLLLVSEKGVLLSFERTISKNMSWDACGNLNDKDSQQHYEFEMTSFCEANPYGFGYFVLSYCSNQDS